MFFGDIYIRGRVYMAGCMYYDRGKILMMQYRRWDDFCYIYNGGRIFIRIYISLGEKY